MKKILSVVIALLLLLLCSCGAKVEEENAPSYYKGENLTEAEKFVNEYEIFPEEYLGSFDSDSSLERREFATVLYKMAGEPEVENKYKLIQTDEGAFYYDACMFTSCNNMTLDMKIDAGEDNFWVTVKKQEAPVPTQTFYVDDIKMPYLEVVYGLYNYAKYAGIDCETESDSVLESQDETKLIDLYKIPSYKKAFDGIGASSFGESLFEDSTWIDISDCYAWAQGAGIIEADENGNYKTESEITHAEFAEIMERFYTNVLNA